MSDLNRPPLDLSLDDLVGQRPLLLLFAPYRDNGPLQWQQQNLAVNEGALARRNVMLIVIVGEDEGYADARAISRESIARVREQMEAEFKTFTIVLLDQDGRELLWQTKPIKMPELFALLDAPAQNKAEP